MNPCLTEDDIRAEIIRCALHVIAAGYKSVNEVTIDMNMRGHTTLGMCRQRGSDFILRFNKALWAGMTDATRLDTVRHEYAHAVDLHNRGQSNHDEHWRKLAVIVGAEPTACQDTMTMGAEAIAVHKKMQAKLTMDWTCRNRRGCSAVGRISKRRGNQHLNLAREGLKSPLCCVKCGGAVDVTETRD